MDKIIKPKVSIVVPIYRKMPNAEFFIERCLSSIREQSFQDYEIVMTEDGKMAENTNSGIKKATGELIKILYQDDMFAHKHALKDIVENFKGHWMITGVDNNPHPHWTKDIETGNNKLGSPSALTIKNEDPLLFDENLGWLLDVDLYKRMYDKYGAPTILDDVNVIMGIGDHQASNIMGDEVKLKEANYLKQKHESTLR